MKSGVFVGFGVALGAGLPGMGFAIVLVAFDAGFGVHLSSAKIVGVASTIVSRVMRVILFVTGLLLFEFVLNSKICKSFVLLL